jgi:hypothetical protein
MRIRRYNESEVYDLSFVDFKEVMSEITDDLEIDYEFRDKSNYLPGDNSPFYALDIMFKEKEYIETSNILGFDYVSGNYLAKIGSSEDGGDSIFDPDIKIERVIDTIRGNGRKINKIKLKLDRQIKKDENMIFILTKLNGIKSRLKSYTNCDDVRIGTEGIGGGGGSALVITFEIKKGK